jgi:hypothetical protein
MKRTLTLLLVVCFNLDIPPSAPAQQIPLLSDLFARYEVFNRLYSEKLKAGANLSAYQPLRRRLATSPTAWRN